MHAAKPGIERQLAPQEAQSERGALGVAAGVGRGARGSDTNGPAARPQVGDADGDPAVQRPAQQGLGCASVVAGVFAEPPELRGVRADRSGRGDAVLIGRQPGLAPCRAHGRPQGVDAVRQGLFEGGLRGRPQQRGDRLRQTARVVEVPRSRRPGLWRPAPQRAELARQVADLAAGHHQARAQCPPGGARVGRQVLDDEQDRQARVVSVQRQQRVAGAAGIGCDDHDGVPVAAAQHALEHRGVRLDALQARQRGPDAAQRRLQWVTPGGDQQDVGAPGARDRGGRALGGRGGVQIHVLPS